MYGTKYVSVASIATTFFGSFLIFVPYLDFVYFSSTPFYFLDYSGVELINLLMIFCILFFSSIIIVLKHLPNIHRLLLNTENKIGQKNKNKQCEVKDNIENKEGENNNKIASC
jgi:glycerol-3-phosphate acyltransferase PlsY